MKVGIVGSGAMGSGIARVAAEAGEEVFLFDSNKEALQRAGMNLFEAFKAQVEKGRLPAGDADIILKRIFPVSSLKDLASCDLIIEAVVEDIGVKHQVFRELEAVVARQCILATNTSSFSIAGISSACVVKERVIGLHFFNPAPVMPLVEVIPGILTVENLSSLCIELMKKWNKIPVLAKDMPGFIVNRVARSFYGESIRILEEGIASVATVDYAMKTFGGFRMGPFELMDFIGNDINFRVTESVWTQFFYEPRFKPSVTQKRLFEAGLYGKKSGRGYYNYASGSDRPQPDTDPELGRRIADRVIVMLINEAAEALYSGLASKDDIELAMTKGVNYPKGLLHWCDELGADAVCRQLRTLHEAYGEERYRPSLLLKIMTAERKKFFS
ncbi:MAG: 3-hydroxybutyryl-CoA dehydrogenase [Bacteroidia bacterium]|nr:3-hydroxybutyryl-CoA dehydrogenase [Bacteroidia bacterium]